MKPPCYVRIAVGLLMVSHATPTVSSGQEDRPPDVARPRESAAAETTAASLSALQQQMLEMRRLIEQQNRTIEQQNRTIDSLKRKVESEPGPAPSLVVPAARSVSRETPSPADSELDERIHAAIANFQAKADKPDAPKIFEVGKNLDLNATWNHGMWLESADKALRVHAGGRAQADAVWPDADNDVQFGPGGTGLIEDGVNFRRARLAIEGTFYEVIDFNTEYDFLNATNSPPPGSNTSVPTDLYVTILKLPVVGNLRLGNQKPPISFEHLTSSRFLNFLERSLTFDAFVGGLDNGFRPGMQLFNTAFDDRMTWAIGIFKTMNRPFGWNVGDGEGDLTGRLTFLPWYSEDGRCLVHVGIGASHRDLDDDEARFRARTLLRNGPGHLHTVLGETRVIGDNGDLIIPEFVMVWGRWTIQTEYSAAYVHDVESRVVPGPASPLDAGTYFAQGSYVEVLYFLTGENRVYDRKYPRFTRVIPNENYFCVSGEDGAQISGRGAWQVAARYSWIDLDDGDINGGEIDDVTLGLNWFLNPNMKIQWNYSWAWRDAAGSGSDGQVQGFGMRFAIDF